MLTFTGHQAPVRCVAYSPNGTQLASGSEDGSVRVSEPAGEAKVWQKLPGSIEAIAFPSDGRLLLAGTSEGSLIAFDPNKKNKKPWWTHPAHESGVNSIVPLPNSPNQVITIGWDREVRIWDLERQEYEDLCEKVESAPSRAVGSPDGKSLAISLSHTSKILVVDVAQSVPQRELDLGQGSAFSLSYSPDGALFAAGDSQGRILVWETAHFSEPRVLAGHTWTIYGLAFSPDGRRIISAGADGTARVWEVGTWRESNVFEWHKSWVTCLAISPEGTTVATGGEDHTIRVWDMPE